MKNILISVVGDRDPIDHKLFDLTDAKKISSALLLDPGPLWETYDLFKTKEKLVTPHGPIDLAFPIDKIWLLYADDNQEKHIVDRVLWLKRFFEAEGIAVEEHDLKVSKPNDYCSLIPNMSLAVARIQEREGEANYYILTSPGTPQMSTTWILLGNEGRIRGHFLQKDPGKRSYITTRGVRKTASRTDSGRLHLVSLSPFFEHEKVEQIALLLEKQMAFSSCSILLNSVSNASLFGSRKPFYDACAAFCNLISLWELNNYKDALKIATQSEVQLRLLLSVINDHLYEEVVQSLKLLGQTEYSIETTLESVKNLLARAERAGVAGDPTSSVTWAFLAYETALAGILRNEPYNLLDFDKGTVLQKENRLLGTEFNFWNGAQNVKCAGLHVAHSGMQNVRSDFSLNRLLIDLRKTRNDIIHKNVVVSSTRAKRLVADAVKIVAVILNLPQQELIDFPYSADLGKEVASVVRRIVRSF